MTLLSAIPGFQLSHPSHRAHTASVLHSIFKKMICSRGGNSGSVIQVGSLARHPYVTLNILQSFPGHSCVLVMSFLWATRKMEVYS